MFQCSRSRRCNFTQQKRNQNRKNKHDEIKKTAEENRDRAYNKKHRITPSYVFSKQSAYLNKYFDLSS